MRTRFDSAFQRGSLRDQENPVVRLNAVAPLAISKLAVTALFSQINEGLEHGGAEVGGLLVGSKTGTGAVLVDEIVRIDNHPRFGSSFHLAAEELADLERTVRSVSVSKTVAGIYRSRVQGEERLRESDREILRVVEKAYASFSHDFRFFVMCDPISRFALCAAVAYREDTEWQEWRQFTMRIYPSEGSLPAVEVWADEQPPSTSASATTLSEDAETKTHAESPRIINLTAEPDTEKSFRSERVYKPSDSAKHTVSAPKPIPVVRPPAWKYLSAIAIFVVLGAVYGTFHAKRAPRIADLQRTAPAPVTVSVRNSRLGFSANPENLLWKLTWNRDAVANLHPVDAVLSILDGGQERRIPLLAPDLATGVAFYTPRTGDLVFELKVDIPGGEPVEEHVRVVQADRIAVEPAEAPAENAADGIVTRFVRPFDPKVAAATPKPAREENQITEMPAPPPLSALLGSTSSASVGPPLQVPILPQPRLPVSVAPQVGRASYSPPQVVFQVTPIAPLNLPSGKGSEVHVVVDIDDTGKVTRVTPIGLTATNFSLVAVATQAANKWRFRPAIQDGRPVASKMNLTFNFGLK